MRWDWETKYKGHTIEVEAGYLWQRLFIDERQVARRIAWSGALAAPIPQGNGAGEMVRVNLSYRLPLWRMRCRISANGKIVMQEDRDGMSPWLAWFLTVWIAYGLLSLAYLGIRQALD